MRKTSKYDYVAMTEENAPSYFLEICKRYGEYCRKLLDSAYVICDAEPKLTGMTGRSSDSIPSSNRNVDRYYNATLWNKVEKASYEMNYYYQLRNWIHSVIARIPSSKYAALILNCYINGDSTIVEFARVFHTDANDMRKGLIKYLKMTITEEDIVGFNQLSQN